MRVSETEVRNLAQILRDLNYADEARPIILARPAGGEHCLRREFSSELKATD